MLDLVTLEVLFQGVRIKDSIILDNVEIKNDACILNAVIGWDSKIGQWVRVEFDFV